MTFNFDEEVDRKGTHSNKWEFIPDGDDWKYGDYADKKHGANRLLPMWVADMDFRVPQAVIDALAARVEHGIFGYTRPADHYFETVIEWMARRYGRSVKKEWLLLTPGVVPAIHMMVQAYLQPGDKVLVQGPVYYPFYDAVNNNGCEIVSNSLVLEDACIEHGRSGRYCMNFDDLAEKAADPAVKMAILCSPHNPVGRVWTKEELTRFGEICLANDVLVISDEIHCDLIFDDVTFTSFANISDEFEQKSIVCTAPSKTFNLAGLKTSNIVIPDKVLRDKLDQQMTNCGIWGTNAFGIVATEAAYQYGEPWLDAAMTYIQDNYHFMVDFLAQNLPQLKVIQARRHLPDLG